MSAQRTRIKICGITNAEDAAAAVKACGALVQRLKPGVDFTREIQLTRALGIGDTVLLNGREGVAGFALCHAAALIAGRPHDELRVLKLAVDDSASFGPLVTAIAGYAREAGIPRAALRVQGDYPDAYRHLVTTGARVRWTDLRMTLAGHEEHVSAQGVVLSNWEI